MDQILTVHPHLIDPAPMLAKWQIAGLFDSPQNYRLNHVRRCFPEHSNAVVQDWISKNLVSCGREDRGSTYYCTFSEPEIVQIGITGHLSFYGAFRQGVTAWLHLDEPTKTALLPTMVGGPFPVSSPRVMVGYCVALGYDVFVTTWPTAPYPTNPGDDRVKRAKIHYEIMFSQGVRPIRKITSMAVINVARIRDHVAGVLHP